MTAFNDLLDLRTAVVEAVGKPDIADVFPRLVLLTESAINRDLRTRDMVTSNTLTFASGEAAVPDNFVEAIGLYDAAGCEYVQQPLQQVKTTGARYWYALSADKIVIYGHNGDLALEYYAAVPTISGSMTATNWLLAKFPEIYLYGVATQAAKYMRDVEAAKTFAGLYGMALSDARSADFEARYSRARVRIAGVTP